ncbi:hypothetical protein Salat_2516600 [Sesamum alatum]|uniref:Uncharacterized protein n=1 Tax=Sesamum alatum TaxID=300844 RepID=A0AAE1XSQ9_9LAMI|nr:hypothetical protein Salat_2516600 [Sesamum alatum]
MQENTEEVRRGNEEISGWKIIKSHPIRRQARDKFTQQVISSAKSKKQISTGNTEDTNAREMNSRVNALKKSNNKIWVPKGDLPPDNTSARGNLHQSEIACREEQANPPPHSAYSPASMQNQEQREEDQLDGMEPTETEPSSHVEVDVVFNT